MRSLVVGTRFQRIVQCHLVQSGVKIGISIIRVERNGLFRKLKPCFVFTLDVRDIRFVSQDSATECVRAPIHQHSKYDDRAHCACVP